MSRINIPSDNELRQQLKAEQARFKELSAEKEAFLNGLSTTGVLQSITIDEYELLKSQLKDSAEQIAYLYKKLHPHFPVGACSHCGSVTTKILGSGRNHYGCLACGEETIS